MNKIFFRNLKLNIFFILSIVDCDPSYQAIDNLITIYISKPNEFKIDPETQLKIGEILAKAVRNMGELVPHFGQKLLNAFLIGTKHSDEFVRASSLSNIGETCKILNFGLQINLCEIIFCLSSIIDTDKSINVKRSATMVIKMIIDGLKKETFIQVLGSSIRNLFHLLMKTKSNCQDDIIQLNCQLALDYLNEIMDKSIFPERSLRKEIKVLDI